MSGKTVVVDFVKTESCRIMLDIEDVTNKNGVIDKDIIEELCLEKYLRNEVVLLGSSSHGIFKVVDNQDLENY